METSIETYRERLQRELDARRAKNGAYSLRAFARMLEISPAQLSQVLSGRRPLTAKSARKISQKLNLSPADQRQFIESTLENYSSDSFPTLYDLPEQQFQLIANWYYLATLSLSELRHHRADPVWIASQLNITISEAAKVMTQLHAMGIIEIRNGQFKQVIKPLRIAPEISSAAIRSYHQQNLSLAQKKLEEVPMELREFSSITSAVSSKNISRAKKLINRFKRDLSSLLEAGDKDSVYTLAIQLFPVSKLEMK